MSPDSPHHPTTQFISCSSPSDVVFVLWQQFKGPDQLWGSDDLWTPDSSLHLFTSDHKATSPLYYAVLCGFQDLVQHLLNKYP